MNLHRRPLFVAICGVVCFCVGVWLRFHAVAVATATLHSGIQFTNMGPTIADSARGDAFYDVATPLLWAGAALMVLAAIVSLVPVWRDRSTVTPQQTSTRTA